MFLKLINWIAISIFKLLGWKTAGHFPIDKKKYPKTIVIVAPHATAWDIPVGLGTRPQMKQKVGFLGKKELFEGWLGPLFRAFGGTPVDRSAPHGLVGEVVEYFHSQPEVCLVITPEGTRKNVKELKRGFYHMAIATNAPIVMAGFDYPRKMVLFSEPFFPVGDWNEDKVTIAKYFSTIQGVQKDWIQNYLAPKE